MLEVLYEIMLEHLTRIYIVCLEAQRNAGCPEEIQSNGQDDEKCNRIRKHKAAQRTDTGLFVVFLAVNNDQGIEGKHGRAYVNSRVTDTECRLSQFGCNTDGHEHGHEDRRQNGPLSRGGCNEQVQ